MIIVDFFKWLGFMFSSKSRGYSAIEPSARGLLILSKRYGKVPVYKEKVCPLCRQHFWDYTGRKVCLRFRCFRKQNAKS